MEVVREQRVNVKIQATRDGLLTVRDLSLF